MTTQAAAEPKGALKARRPVSHQPTRHLYDVIVLGAQLGATLAGALLAKRGYQVLLVDPEGLGPTYQDQGYELPYAPSVMPSLKAIPLAEQALEELGIAVQVNRTLEAGGDSVQLLFPRNRLDLPPDPPRRSAELGREFPSELQGLAAALERAAGVAEATDPFFKPTLPLPPNGFFDRWALRRAAKAVPALANPGEALDAVRSHPVGQALEALSRFASYLDDGEAGPLARARPLAHLLKGARRLPGGPLGLRDLVRGRLLELGGDCVGGPGEPAPVEELLFEGSRLSGVRLASAKADPKARCVVLGLDLQSLGSLIPPKAKKRKLVDLVESVRDRRTLFAVNLVVREEGLPLGLGDLALLHPGDEQIGPLLAQSFPATRQGQPVPGVRVLSAAGFVPAAEVEAGGERVKELAARIEAALLELAPFAEGHVLARSVPLTDAAAARGHRLAPHPLVELGDEPWLGIAGLRHRTPCKNLFVANRQVLPGLGVEGELMAGLRAAALVQEQLRKHDPLK